jgi:hypothetical protein
VGAFVAAVLSLALIRQKDFVIRTGPAESPADEQQRDRAAV